jgi:hypothetical protein
MTDAQTTTAPPQKRPRGGPATWKRHYCDPAVSPKHAKGLVGGSPRTSPERTPRSQDLAFSVVKEIAGIVAPYTRHQEPPSVVADVLLRVLPMPDCARSTIALVVHRKGTGSCDNLTYRQAGALGGCDRRTAIDRFARTESYGFIHMEQRDYECGGAAPNLVTTKIPSWVYDQVDDYNAIPAILRPPDERAAVAPASAGGALPRATSLPQVELTAAAPVEASPQVELTAAAPAEARTVPDAAAGVAPPLVASPSPDTTATSPPSSAAPASHVLPTPAGAKPFVPAPVLSPEDAAIDARLVQIHAITRQRFDVAAVRGLNAQVPPLIADAEKPELADEQIPLALDEYIKRELPEFERKARYRKRIGDRDWVKNGIHAYLWGMRKRLKGQAARDSAVHASKNAQGEQQRRSPAARRRPRASVSATLAAAAAPVELGADLEQFSTIVRSVRPGSIAARLMLQPGDKVVRVDDQAIKSLDDLRVVLSTIAPGPHTFGLVRSNDIVTATVTLEPRGPPST